MEFIVPKSETPKTDKIALIDADYIKYLVTNDMFKDFKAESRVIFKNPVHHYTQERLDNIFSSFEAKGYLFCFSGPSVNTFRCAVSFDKPYKGNRTYVENYENELADKMEVVDYIKNRYPSLIYNDLEADDLLCMLQDDETFIYSNDKDLKQIAGTHWDIKEHKFVQITEAEAFEFLMKQIVTGDSVDNITGLYGYGDVKSEKLLTDIPVKHMPNKVLTEYIKNHGFFNGIDMFVETWNLIRLRNNRGTNFLSKYKGAFDVLRMLKNQKL